MNKWQEIGISTCMNYYLYACIDDGVLLFNTHTVKEDFQQDYPCGYYEYQAIEKLKNIEFKLYKRGE